MRAEKFLAIFRHYICKLSLLEFTCPKSFGAVCSVAGVCDTSTGQCICDLGRHGSDCSSEYFFF